MKDIKVAELAIAPGASEIGSVVVVISHPIFIGFMPPPL